MANVRSAALAADRPCLVAMDLVGPAAPAPLALRRRSWLRPSRNLLARSSPRAGPG